MYLSRFLMVICMCSSFAASCNNSGKNKEEVDACYFKWNLVHEGNSSNMVLFESVIPEYVNSYSIAILHKKIRDPIANSNVVSFLKEIKGNETLKAFIQMDYTEVGKIHLDVEVSKLKIEKIICKNINISVTSIGGSHISHVFSEFKNKNLNEISIPCSAIELELDDEDVYYVVDF